MRAEPVGSSKNPPPALSVSSADDPDPAEEEDGEDGEDREDGMKKF
jgi:hypothetical protein